MKYQQQYDVVVIGGGIQGAGIALAARKAGYSVLLVEKNTWASATSSKSSKLIHGGLRYLQTFQFKLVYECLKERDWMLKRLPQLVKPNWFYIPIYRHSFYRPWKIYSGLLLYRLLAGYSDYSAFRKVPREEWQQLPHLQQKDLQAVFAYQDAQTDDADLTREVVEKLVSTGGHIAEHTLCEGAKLIDGLYQLQLYQSDLSFQTYASVIVNATGPWINQTLSTLLPESELLPVDLVQGSHLIVSPQLSEQCFYLQAPQDNRAVFCLPWKGKTLIGTTEKIHSGLPEAAEIGSDEIHYLCEVVKQYFPDYDFTVESTFCGLRVLPCSKKKAFSRSRDTILISHGKVISVYGGKLTSWRATAVKTVVEIHRLLCRNLPFDPDSMMDS